MSEKSSNQEVPNELSQIHYIDTHTLFDAILRMLDSIGGDYVVNYCLVS